MCTSLLQAIAGRYRVRFPEMHIETLSFSCNAYSPDKNELLQSYLLTFKEKTYTHHAGADT